jgi:hypothetical protein
LAQHLNRRVAISQFSAFGLCEASLDVGGYRLAFFGHPVFELKLLADNLERLFQDLLGVLICTGLDCKVDHALLFWLKVNRHFFTLSGSYHGVNLFPVADFRLPRRKCRISQNQRSYCQQSRDGNPGGHRVDIDHHN